jgi:hypothetical protein
MCVRWLLSATKLTRWRRPVASTKAMVLLYWLMHTVPYRCTAAAIKMACKVGPIFCCCFICCWTGGRWGNTERVVARWQCPVASGVALDMPHQAMPSVSLRRTAMAINMANDGGTF